MVCHLEVKSGELHLAVKELNYLNSELKKMLGIYRLRSQGQKVFEALLLIPNSNSGRWPKLLVVSRLEKGVIQLISLI